MTKTLGVYGGAFDPPHNAHVSLVRSFQTEHPGSAVVILPTGQAWHKARKLTDSLHRVAMARLAFANLAHVTIDTREIERAGPSYTIDTLQELQVEHPNTKLFLILGDDQYQVFHTWHRWQDILKIATLQVTARSVMPISSTQIRADLDNGAIPSLVASYIHQHHLYNGNQ